MARHGNKVEVVRLDAEGFIRSPLLHALLRGFIGLRHYGLLSDRYRARKPTLCRGLLYQSAPKAGESESTREMLWQLTEIDITAVAQCGKGTLRQILFRELQHRTEMPARETGSL